jgi:hypothetical protein
MIIKVKSETENPHVFCVDQPAKYNNGHHELYCIFDGIAPEIGKSYSANPVHKWVDINYKETVIAHCIVSNGASVDDNYSVYA